MTGSGTCSRGTRREKLYRYNGTGTGLLKDRVKVFSAWGASYDAIVGVGDITGDGKNDLVERDTLGERLPQRRLRGRARSAPG